jgi:hypothetical protein
VARAGIHHFPIFFHNESIFLDYSDSNVTFDKICFQNDSILHFCKPGSYIDVKIMN